MRLIQIGRRVFDADEIRDMRFGVDVDHIVFVSICFPDGWIRFDGPRECEAIQEWLDQEPSVVYQNMTPGREATGKSTVEDLVDCMVDHLDVMEPVYRNRGRRTRTQNRSRPHPQKKPRPQRQIPKRARIHPEFQRWTNEKWK